MSTTPPSRPPSRPVRGTVIAKLALALCWLAVSSMPANAQDGLSAPPRSLDEARPALWIPAIVLKPGDPRHPIPNGFDFRAPALEHPLWNAAPDPRALIAFATSPVRTSNAAQRHMTARVFATGDAHEMSCVRNMRSPECRALVPLRWRAMIDMVPKALPFAVLARLNTEVNAAITYRTDLDSHGVLEHWAHPTETLQSAHGDCEDYAILKLWLLAYAGIPVDDMFVLVVRSPALPTQHAVLAVRLRGDVLILDNLATTVKWARHTPLYKPVFSVNRNGLWAHVRPSDRVVEISQR